MLEYVISIDGVLDSETIELPNKKDLGQFQQPESLSPTQFGQKFQNAG